MSVEFTSALEFTFSSQHRQTVFKNGVEVGEVSYFKTQYTVDDINGIHSFIIYAEAQTLQYPRKTLYANRIFSI